MNYSRLLLFCLALAFTQSLARAGDELDFLSGLEESRTLRQMLPNHVNGLARACLEARRQKIAFLTTAEAVLDRKQYVRERILTAIGGLPEKSPLNPRLVGVLERPGYRIEKLVFESQPRFYVTAHLYVPKSGRPPYPAILFPLGHEIDTKARPTWQRMLGTLATRGYVVLTYDPIGQGERIQLYDPDWGESKVFRNNTEHTIIGVQCMLVGDSLARYSICDGLRALDYLVSRPEVDSKRIACTGNSGGGNLTAYLAALDDRIQVAAPSCWITSWQGLLETIGHQDAEQVLIPALKEGLDYADFVYAFAPKPYLILSAMSDFFSITGTRETYDEAKRLYGVLGVSEKLERAEAAAGHDYSETLRMAAYRWFGRWLKGVEGNDAEVAVTLAFEEELRCTPTGQVHTSLGGETVFSLNQKRVQALGRSLPELKNRADFTRFQEKTQQQVRQLLDLKTSQAEDKLAPVVRSYGQVVRSGYRIERLTYESEPGILIPTLLFLPESPPGRKAAVVYVDGGGKSVAAGPGQDLEQLAQGGLVVMAIDVRGSGETEVLESQQAHDVRPYFGDYDSAMTALLVGKPLAGMRALDISRGIDLLQQRTEVDPERIYGFGKGTASVPLLHAAVLDARLKKVVLEDMFWSYQAIVDNRIHRQVFENVIASVLRFYDLPDLVAALAPREVWVVNPTDAMQHPLPSQKTLQLYSFAQRAFQLAGDGSRLHVFARTNEAVVKAYQGLR